MRQNLLFKEVIDYLISLLNFIQWKLLFRIQNFILNINNVKYNLTNCQCKLYINKIVNVKEKLKKSLM